MMLRSSSTPVISSLLPHSSDNSNKDLDICHLNLKSSKPPPNSISSSFRKVHSDSNLKGIAAEQSLDLPKQKTSRYFTKPHGSMLRSEPSFCIYSADDDEEHGGVRQEDIERGLKRTVTIGDCIEELAFVGFSFNKRHEMLVPEVNEEEDDVFSGQRLSFGSDLLQTSRSTSPPLYLAAGLGLGADDLDFIGRGDLSFASNALNFNDAVEAEDYYKRMLGEYPCHPLLLRNYARLLQSNGNLHEAAEYYYCATLADPDDGEILSQYAKLIWQLHRDKEKACSYFNQAVQVSPQDNNVLAAYASFLWEIDDDEDDIQIKEKARDNHDNNGVGVQIGGENISSPSANKHEDVEGYHKRMIEENPSNSLVLKNYAQFLYETKGDLQGAEEYYSRAIIADPCDVEAKSRYARLVWELHRDHKKALSYFEQAAQAAPENINVLAAYTNFLWETGGNEQGDRSSTRPNTMQMSNG